MKILFCTALLAAALVFIPPMTPGIRVSPGAGVILVLDTDDTMMHRRKMRRRNHYLH